MNRKEYIRANAGTGDEAARRFHREYYAQFVAPRTINHVVGIIGADRILQSTDRHMNDIPITEWDTASLAMPLKVTFRSLGDHPSHGGLVCIAKEAARQHIEAVLT